MSYSTTFKSNSNIVFLLRKKKMEQHIFKISTLLVLCIALFLSFTTCSANSLQFDVQDDYDLFALKISHSRKLKVMQEAMAAGKGIESQMKFKETTTGKLHGNKETKMKAKRGERWREWEEEGSDPTDLFTMDYRSVRRRRPIHNKLLPARAGP